MIEKQVLDHGYIKLIGTMVSENEDKSCAQTLDEMAVEAARVSYGGALKGPEKDRKLLHYLIEHEHLTPLESAVFKFEVKCPLFTMRQWIRHRWGSFNEVSGRYTDQISDEYYIPAKFRGQDMNNKQGSVDNDLSDVIYGLKDFPDLPSGGWTVKDRYIEAMEDARESYRILLNEGVAKELARGVLGTAFYTQFVWTVNARSLLNFLILRCDSHAQWEIQQYAFALLDILKEKMPWTYEILQQLYPSTFGD